MMKNTSPRMFLLVAQALLCLNLIANENKHFHNGQPPLAGISDHTSPGNELRFEENKGQWEERAKFKSDLGAGKRVFLEEDRFTYVMYDPVQLYNIHEKEKKQLPVNQEKIDFHAFAMKFNHSNPAVIISGHNKKDYHLNYYLGSDPSRWASSVSVYSRFIYKNIYPGIDIEGYAKDKLLKYDYIISAGVDPQQISISFEGHDRVFIKNRTLYIITSVGELVESLPYCYQVINGREVRVKCEYKMDAGNNLSFDFPEGYDRRYSLIIDPVVMASTYTGSTANTFGHCATFDQTGNIYTGGRCFGQGYPTSLGAFQTTFGGSVDITISKMNPTGGSLLYSTYLGGSSFDYPHSLYVHNNELYIYGTTSSTNYPVTSGCYDNTSNGMSDMLVSKLNSNGTSLLASTYIGGAHDDGLNNNASHNYGDNYRGEIIVNVNGEPYISATTSSSDCPTTSGAYDQTYNGEQDAILFKMNSSLSSLVWSTFLGGSGDEASSGLRLNTQGEVIIVGLTEGTGFPVTSGALSTSYNGGTYDGFVAKFDPSGANLVACSFVGGSSLDIAYFVDLDFNGDVYIYGVSNGVMPVSTGVYSNPGSKTFLMKLNTSLTSIMYSTVLGNGQTTQFSPSAFMVDLCQNVYMAGWGNTNNYPVTSNAVQSTTDFSDFYLMVLAPNAVALSYGTYYGAPNGGEHVDGGTSRFDPNGLVYQAVCECSGNFPTLAASVSTVNNSTSCDVAVFKIDFQINCNPLMTNTTICYGSTASLQLLNFQNLTNASYSIQPGGNVSSNPVFTVAPTSTSAYTLFITGTNYLNATVTHSGVATVSVVAQPTVSPTFTQSSCTSNNNAFDLNLVFLPSQGNVTYSVNWSSIPFGILSNSQTASSGGIVAGQYDATVQASNGCAVQTTFSIHPVPEPLEFSILGPRQITCHTPVLNLNIDPGTNTYTWTSLSATLTGTNALFTGTNVGTWTVTGINTISGCTNSQTFAVTQNTTVATSTITPMIQTIDCISPVITVTATGTPTSNVQHIWLSPMGGTLITYGQPGLYSPGPGTYTHIMLNTENGCEAVKVFTVNTSSGFPTYSVSSPQNFTLGCSTKSIITIDVLNAQTTPVGGSVTYTLLTPSSGSTYTTSPVSTFTNVTLPGTYTVITRDNTNSCETKQVISVLQNTFTPQLSAVVPGTVLTCDVPSTILKASSTTSNVSFTWSFPETPGSLTSSSIQIVTKGSSSSSLIANYTLTIQDMNNTCISQSVVPMFQNIYAPNASFSGAAPISCKVPTVMLTNQSSSNIPPFFNPSLPVVGYTWKGPSPQVDQQLSTTYYAATPGTYTLIAKDMNNGCISTATGSVEDNRDYPLVEEPPPFIFDCGATAVEIYPIITTPTTGLTYTWLAVSNTSFSTYNAMKTFINNEGTFHLIVHDPSNGCTSSGHVEVIRGTLDARFTVPAHTGFAPMSVKFTNESSSSSTITGSQGITSHWSFGNGQSLGPVSSTADPVTEFKQPGTYTVVLYSTKGNCIDSTSHIFEIEVPSALEVPNVFSPNGDGVNDDFFIIGANLTEITASIYDRWGHMVYSVSSSTGNIRWDGKNQTGKEVAEGVYYYVLSAKGSDGSTYDRNGTITLVR